MSYEVLRQIVKYKEDLEALRRLPGQEAARYRLKAFWSQRSHSGSSGAAKSWRKFQ